MAAVVVAVLEQVSTAVQVVQAVVVQAVTLEIRLVDRAVLTQAAAVVVQEILQ
jgi:hypothetical protein